MMKIHHHLIVLLLICIVSKNAEAQDYPPPQDPRHYSHDTKPTLSFGIYIDVAQILNFVWKHKIEIACATAVAADLYFNGEQGITFATTKTIRSYASSFGSYLSDSLLGETIRSHLYPKIILTNSSNYADYVRACFACTVDNKRSPSALNQLWESSFAKATRNGLYNLYELQPELLRKLETELTGVPNDFISSLSLCKGISY